MARKTNMTVDVFLWGVRIGILEWNAGQARAAFQFTQEYMDSDIDLSLVSAPKDASWHRTFWGNRGDKYQGLPEFIADSLPDNWGNTLFDQWTKENGIPLMDINSLMKLSFIGSRGMGAFEFVPETDLSKDTSLIDIGALYEMALNVLSDRKEKILSSSEKRTMEKLILLGTSAGGKHAKGVIAINDVTGDIRSGQVALPEEYNYYILKFKEDPSVPTSEIEKVYYEMATAAGIDMMPSRLFETDGIKHFLTKRFDRKNGGEKILSQTLAAISPNARDYMNLFWLSEKMQLPYTQKEQLFRRMVFNHVAGVTDDHNKNFSFLMDRDGTWSLSPAYDVMFTANVWADPSAIAHSLSLGGKNAHITTGDLLDFADDFGIVNPKQIIETVCMSVSRFMPLCEETGIKGEWPSRIWEVLQSLFPEEYKSILLSSPDRPAKVLTDKQKGNLERYRKYKNAGKGTKESNTPHK